MSSSASASASTAPTPANDMFEELRNLPISSLNDDKSCIFYGESINHTILVKRFAISWLIYVFGGKIDKANIDPNHAAQILRLFVVPIETVIATINALNLHANASTDYTIAGSTNLDDDTSTKIIARCPINRNGSESIIVYRNRSKKHVVSIHRTKSDDWTINVVDSADLETIGIKHGFRRVECQSVPAEVVELIAENLSLLDDSETLKSIYLKEVNRYVHDIMLPKYNSKTINLLNELYLCYHNAIKN